MNELIFGWKDSNEVANDVYDSVHSSLLGGYLLFGYKGSGELSRVIVVTDIDPITRNVIGNSYSVGTITKGYTALIPHVPIDYLEKEVLLDLKNYKVDKKIIESFEKLINKEKNNEQ